MPTYLYKNTESQEYVEVVQGMNDIHEYYGESGNEDCWVRVFTKPNAGIDSRIDPFSKKDFRRATENKRGTVGDLWDKSAELSEKRAEKAGSDPVKDKLFKDYSDQRGGTLHHLQRKENMKKKLGDMGVKVTE